MIICFTDASLVVCSTTTLPHRCRWGRPPHQPVQPQGTRRKLLLLPPYSPDFNPIEKAFARLKAMLRKAGERTVSSLWSLIGRLVDLFQPQECANYFN